MNIAEIESEIALIQQRYIYKWYSICKYLCKWYVNTGFLSVIWFQALPIFLDGLVEAWGAVLISVTLILVFGEVITNCHKPNSLLLKW